MAEKFANRFDYSDNSNYENCYKKDPDKVAYESYLAGLKAGRPQWHDLRKDKNDLPKEDCQVITVGKSPRRLLIKKVAYYLRSEKKFTIWNKEYENFTKLYNVIAWCEIPTFDKE